MRWLGKIPAHWEEERAKFLFREVDDRTKTGKEELLSVSHLTGVTRRQQKNVTMFKAADYTGHKLCQPGDLVVNTMWAWMAALGVSEQSGIVSPSYAMYRPIHNRSFNPKFLDYLLRINAYKCEYVIRSTGIRPSRLRLYPDSFLDIPFVCPPREEQDWIVNYLRTHDRALARYVCVKQRLIELLNEQKQSIIRRIVIRGLGSDVRLRPSGINWLGDVPEHWLLKRLKYCVDFVGGGTPSKAVEEYWDGDIPWVSPKDMQFDLADRITNRALQESATKIVPKGAVLLVVRSGILRRKIPISINQVDVTLNQDMKALVPKKGLTSGYLAALIQGNQKALLQTWMKLGATVESIEFDLLANTVIPVPPEFEQEQILASLSNSLSEIEKALCSLKIAIQKLLEYRDLLISDAVTGRVDVRGWPPPGDANDDQGTVARLIADEVAVTDEVEGDDNANR